MLAEAIEKLSVESQEKALTGLQHTLVLAGAGRISRVTLVSRVGLAFSSTGERQPLQDTDTEQLADVVPAQPSGDRPRIIAPPAAPLPPELWVYRYERLIATVTVGDHSGSYLISIPIPLGDPRRDRIQIERKAPRAVDAILRIPE
ncbi:hypothetical protein ABZ470_23675 [Streptosporangium sp. NPDC020072]|uniref:hypothetical protein n=1 Tax=Streptosporangium sp. NPDC020072 TaxID=3154788 RepID=UPI0034457F30